MGSTSFELNVVCHPISELKTIIKAQQQPTSWINDISGLFPGLFQTIAAGVDDFQLLWTIDVCALNYIINAKVLASDIRGKQEYGGIKKILKNAVEIYKRKSTIFSSINLLPSHTNRIAFATIFHSLSIVFHHQKCFWLSKW